jgi:hypothetical protein
VFVTPWGEGLLTVDAKGLGEAWQEIGVLVGRLSRMGLGHAAIRRIFEDHFALLGGLG